MRLRYAYESKEAYHLILPLAMGGDLKYHLKDGGFQPERCRIYAAEVALGLGHIHSLGLVIRDLKPRNILLNSKVWFCSPPTPYLTDCSWWFFVS